MQRLAILSLVVLALIGLPVMRVSAATGPWTIEILDDVGVPVAPDGLEGGSNFTVQIGIGQISADGSRYLIITSSLTNSSFPLYRKSLGFFATTYNGTRQINVTLSLRTFQAEINPKGDYLHIWVERTGGAIEADAGNIVVKADIDRLLEQQLQFFLGFMQGVQRDFDNQVYYLKETVRQLTNYIIALALLVLFIGGFSARDLLRKNTKAAKQAEANRSATDMWLRHYIAERFGAIDAAQLKVDKFAEETKNGP